jgi:hypothetical protein
MLNKSKLEVAQIAKMAAQDAIRDRSGMGYSMSNYSLMGQLSELIAAAVEAGILATLNQMYTNEEFERDLGLKP